LSKDRKNYNIYSIKSPGPEGLAWAFKISSQALSHGLRRALAWLGLGFSGPGLAWLRASGQACTSLVVMGPTSPKGLERLSKGFAVSVQIHNETNRATCAQVCWVLIIPLTRTCGCTPRTTFLKGAVADHVRPRSKMNSILSTILGTSLFLS